MPSDTCSASQLTLSLDGGDGQFNGMSHSGTLLIVRNTGTGACMIPVQPRLTLTDAGKQRLDIAAQAPVGTQPAPTSPTILLLPGASAQSEMRWVSGDVYDGSHCESPARIALAIGKESLATAFAGHLCGAGGKPSTYTLTPFRSAAPAVIAASKALSYVCDDGRHVQAIYPDTNTAVLTLDGQSHYLHTAISADGARYISDKWQWWTKGMHAAWLAPLAPGETYASANGVSCHAP